MSSWTPQQKAGLVLKRLIQERYSSQEEFALDYGMELRTVSRYVNQGINKISVVQELADFFALEFEDFFRI
ncbi:MULTISPECIES: helix-turn-helix domain-containing protein [Intestinimonas]|uniref:helix-turn-helix domain-containing protein n=1 Tax=Intestinimonas TaxID=1392389 RepID=UPI00051B4110|nr:MULTISPECIES: helix-turn-helix transcriptional regulator [Intestinimonas]